jgi:hypothetical protein
LAVLLVGLANGDRRPLYLVRLGGFDAYQVLWPRVRVSAPAIIVEIDAPFEVLICPTSSARAGAVSVARRQNPTGTT